MLYCNYDLFSRLFTKTAHLVRVLVSLANLGQNNMMRLVLILAVMESTDILSCIILSLTSPKKSSIQATNILWIGY